jgi:beta-1,4-mannooligosaccharide/beta-1,4-mannosyl-N-acetylglucosamine phosphorylase
MIFKRHGDGPLLTREDIPAMPPHIIDPSSVFNPGAVQHNGKTFLLLRVQTRGRRTFTVPAHGDGFTFKVAKRPVEFSGLEKLVDPETGAELVIHHVFDARITALEDSLVVITAVDTDQGCRLAIWQAVGKPQAGSAGLNQLELIGFTSNRDTRNGVLFPARIDGRYLMLDRPNDRRSSGGPSTGRGIVLLASDDLVHWEDLGPVMTGKPHYWDELVGSGPPPVKTREGWLHIYHGVATHFLGANLYQAGAVLLDLEDPRRVLARTRDNLLEPRETWEVTGQVPNVVFPTGLTVSETDEEGFAVTSSELRLYYGAADTVVGLAVSTVAEVLAACESS